MSFLSRLLNKPTAAQGTAAGSGGGLAGQVPGDPVLPPVPAGSSIQPMGQHLQRRFARGVQYNMKIVIRGDSNVGKTCLLARLQGGDFVEEYIPSEEIRVVSVHWSYKTADDVIKVEVWDVVDKGRPKRPGAAGAPVLDAEWVDVYKGCHGVILVLDMTKAWTLAYVARELPRVPEGLPVLVLANHRDMGQHRSVSEAQAREVIRESGRASRATRYAESSMRNGFGLKYIHRFLNLPFLHLQRESLLAQLRTNTEEVGLVIRELDLEEESEENGYDSCVISSKRIEDRKKDTEYQLQLRAKAEAVEQQPHNQQQLPVAKVVPPVAKDAPSVAKDALTVAKDEQQQRPVAPPPRLIPGCERYLMELQRAQTRAPPPASTAPLSSAALSARSRPEPAGAPPAPASIDNFVPPDDDDDSLGAAGGGVIGRGRRAVARGLDKFLENDDEHHHPHPPAAGGFPLPATADSSDDEEAAVNPMVAAFAEDIDSADECRRQARARVASVSDSDSDSDAEDAVATHRSRPALPALQPPVQKPARQLQQLPVSPEPPPAPAVLAGNDDASMAKIPPPDVVGSGDEELELEQFLNDDD